MALTLTLVMASTARASPTIPTRPSTWPSASASPSSAPCASLSQRELAERVDVVQVVVSNYEIGKLRITAEMALRFAAALDVPVQELLQTDTPPEIVQQRKPSRKVLERLEQIQNLPRRKQDAILTTIDHFLRSATGRPRTAHGQPRTVFDLCSIFVRVRHGRGLC